MTSLDAILGEIARHQFRVNTLERRGRDQLDFHSLGVWTLRDGLAAAYEAGHAAACMEGVAYRDRPKEDAPAPAVEPHVVVYHYQRGSGVSYYAVLFTDGGLDGGRKLGIVFDSYEAPPAVAVFDLAKLAAGDITHAGNGWRGDRYERTLRAIVARHQRNA